MRLERLYQDLAPAVWSYLRGQTRDLGIAEELLQETFLAAAAKPAGVEAAVSKRAWLIGIARNLLRGHRRMRRRFASRALDEDYPGPEQPVEDNRLEAMRRAISRLSDGQREVLELRLGDELSYAEIAEALQMPVGTVRSRLHHAIASLKDWAERAGPAGAGQTLAGLD